MKKITLAFLCVFAMSPLLKADAIQRLSAIATGSYPWDVELAANYCFLADRGGLAIIDISDSLNPIMTFRTFGPLQGASGVDISDTLCYCNDKGLTFWIGNIRPPDTIIFLSIYDILNASGPYEPWGIEVRDTILYIADGNRGLYIFNVRDPYNPTQILLYDTPGYVTEFVILDSLIFLADEDSMRILNITDPSSPQYLGAVDIPRAHRDVDVIWPYAYCTSRSGDLYGDEGSLEIVDVSAPSNPTIIGSVNWIYGNPRAVFVTNDFAYIAAEDWWYGSGKGIGRADVEGGVRVAEGVVPDSLNVSYDTPGDPREVIVRGNLIFMPDSDSLQILYHQKTAIEEEEYQTIPLISGFSVYPNPFYEKVTCELEFQRALRITVNVYDRCGRYVRTIYHGPMVPGSATFYWDGRDQERKCVPMGEYFIKISIEKGKDSIAKKVTYLGG
jgi:hypothetical protein